MSFKWQFGCGCNLDKPETCYPRLLWRSIKLSEWRSKVLLLDRITRTGMLLIRLDGPPEIKPLYRGDSPTFLSSDLIGISSLKEIGGGEREIEYEYTQGLYDQYGRLLNFDGNDLIADTSLQPLTIQHYYFQNANVSNRGRRLEHYAFNEYTSSATLAPAEPISFLVDTFYVQPRGADISKIYSSLLNRWGNVNIMVVKCCKTPATYLRTATTGQPDPTRQASRPLNLVAEIRTGRAEWGRELEFTLEKDGKKGTFSYNTSYSGMTTDELGFARQFVVANEDDFLATISEYITRRQDFDGRAFYENYTCTKDRFSVSDSFNIVNEDDSCVVSYLKGSDETNVKTSFVSYVDSIQTGKGIDRRIYERYQSKYSIDELIDDNYKYRSFNKVYEYDYPVKWWGYHIYKNGWHNSSHMVNALGGIYACGAFENDPNRLANPYRINNITIENYYPKLTAPSDFFTYNNIRVRISLDYILEKVYAVCLGGVVNLYNGTEESLQDLLNRLERDRKKVFGTILLQSPVVIGINEMKLNWKRTPYFDSKGKPIYDSNGKLTSYEDDWILNDPFPSIKTRYKFSGTNSVTISPDWGLSYLFDTNVDVGSQNSLFYTTFGTKIPVKQSFFQDQLKDTSCEVRLVCQHGFIDPDEEADWTDPTIEILNDIKENIVEWAELKKTETFHYTRPIQCWTDNVFCVDLKQQFFDENGTKINLVESKPE